MRSMSTVNECFLYSPLNFVDPLGLYPNDSKGWDRLAPVLFNSPLRFVDPSGLYVLDLTSGGNVQQKLSGDFRITVKAGQVGVECRVVRTVRL